MEKENIEEINDLFSPFNAKNSTIKKANRNNSSNVILNLINVDNDNDNDENKVSVFNLNEKEGNNPNVKFNFSYKNKFFPLGNFE